MPTTYSPSLRIALLGNGENAGTWGQLTNTNLGTLLEQSITGVVTVSLSSGNVTLTSFNGVSDQSRNAVIVVTGTQVTTNNVIIPNVPKAYIVNNTSSYQIGIQASGGSTYICPVGTVSNIYCDGAGNVVGVSNATTFSTALTAAPGTNTTAIATTAFVQNQLNPVITGIRETTTISATAASGAIVFYTLNQDIGYYTLNATGNWTINLTGSAGVTLNSLMSTGQSLTATFLATQVSTAYYNSRVYLDGNLITPKWQGGITPVAGNANSVDAYTYAIIKTAAATFTVLASQTRYA
jgi:hypothetical protein